MKRIVFVDEQGALDAAAAISKALGFPRAHTQADLASGLAAQTGPGRFTPIASITTDAHSPPVPLKDGTWAVDWPECAAFDAISGEKVTVSGKQLAVPDKASAVDAAATVQASAAATPVDATAEAKP